MARQKGPATGDGRALKRQLKHMREGRSTYVTMERLGEARSNLKREHGGS